MPLPSVKRPDHGRTDLLILLALLVGGGILTQLSPAGEMAVSRLLRSSVLAPFLSAHERLVSQAHLRSELRKVRSQRDSLAREVTSLRRAALENRQLREQLGMTGPASRPPLVVDVEAGNTKAGRSRSFLLRVGTADGVRPPTGVFTADGLVGIIRTAGEGWSQGEFWTHPDYRVSVRAASTEATGIVRPHRDQDPPAMVMEGAPFQTEITAGTVLYTSGLGGLYPAGVPVGIVQELSAVESGWAKSYRVKPAVRPAEVDVALVWRKPAERP